MLLKVNSCFSTYVCSSYNHLEPYASQMHTRPKFSYENSFWCKNHSLLIFLNKNFSQRKYLWRLISELSTIFFFVKVIKSIHFFKFARKALKICLTCLLQNFPKDHLRKNSGQWSPYLRRSFFILMSLTLFLLLSKFVLYNTCSIPLASTSSLSWQCQYYISTVLFLSPSLFLRLVRDQIYGKRSLSILVWTSWCYWNAALAVNSFSLYL